MKLRLLRNSDRNMVAWIGKAVAKSMQEIVEDTIATEHLLRQATTTIAEREFAVELAVTKFMTHEEARLIDSNGILVEATEETGR